MSSDVAKKLPKPELRHLLRRSIGRNLIGAGISVTITALYMQFFFKEQRKAAYANFYKNYDIQKEFERMRKKGLFDSCPSD